MQSLATTSVQIERVSNIIYLVKETIANDGALDHTEALSDTLMQCYFELDEIKNRLQRLHNEMRLKKRQNNH